MKVAGSRPAGVTTGAVEKKFIAAIYVLRRAIALVQSELLNGKSHSFRTALFTPQCFLFVFCPVFWIGSSTVEQLAVNEKVIGSSPIHSAKCKCTNLSFRKSFGRAFLKTTYQNPFPVELERPSLRRDLG